MDRFRGADDRWLGCQDIGYQVCMAGDGLDLGGVEIHRGIWSPGTVLTSSVGGLKEREMGRERLGNLGDPSTTSEWATICGDQKGRVIRKQIVGQESAPAFLLGWLLLCVPGPWPGWGGVGSSELARGAELSGGLRRKKGRGETEGQKERWNISLTWRPTLPFPGNRKALLGVGAASQGGWLKL